jgi:hypothetical protein
MENNEYFSTKITEETKDWLILLGLNEITSCNDEMATQFIVNKTKNTFWANGHKELNHASQMTTISPTTLNEIKQWQN